MCVYVVVQYFDRECLTVMWHIVIAHTKPSTNY